MNHTDWKRALLGDDIVLISGQHLEPDAYVEQKNDVPYLTGPADFQDGVIVASKYAIRPKVICKAGDILLTVKGSGTGSLVKADRPYCISRQLMAIRPKTWDLDFVYFVLDAQSQKYETAASGLIPGITREYVLDTALWIPPIPQQREIAKLLSQWDQASRTTTNLIDAKLRFKQALMQQLLTGMQRFHGFNEEWQPIRLKDVAEECDERNRGRYGTQAVKAVTKAEGIVPMRERTIGADLNRYLIVRKNWFAYNPMRLNIGSISRWTGDSEILVSPDYVVFHCKEPTSNGVVIDPDYLDHFRRSSIWEQFVTAAGNGSVRIRIYFSDLGRLQLSLPPLREQRKIAEFLNTADQEIDLLRHQLDALKKQKKGLMQKLLTGQVRVKV